MGENFVMLWLDVIEITMWGVQICPVLMIRPVLFVSIGHFAVADPWFILTILSLTKLFHHILKSHFCVTLAIKVSLAE